jgi:hypothetical protein
MRRVKAELSVPSLGFELLVGICEPLVAVPGERIPGSRAITITLVAGGT